MFLPGCIGTTGSDLFEFEALAGGPSDATESGLASFQTSRGYTVTLSRARLHIGAVYLNRSVPVSVSADTTCTLPGIYVAEVPAGVDVDLLSPDLQPFPVRGAATEEQARTGEVWLMGGDINAETDSTRILDIAGTAEHDGEAIPFEGSITIGENRVEAPSNPALPGQNPICKQRIVSPIPLELSIRRGGKLVLRADPRAYFTNVDFETLPPPSVAGGSRRFADGPANQASLNLYSGLRAAVGPYSFEWQE
jgi:hypothetical protein